MRSWISYTFSLCYLLFISFIVFVFIYLSSQKFRTRLREAEFLYIFSVSYFFHIMFIVVYSVYYLTRYCFQFNFAWKSAVSFCCCSTSPPGFQYDLAFAYFCIGRFLDHRTWKLNFSCIRAHHWKIHLISLNFHFLQFILIDSETDRKWTRKKKSYKSNHLILSWSCGGSKKSRLGCKFGANEFTWRWCTWWQPWCPQRRRVWPVHRGGGGGQRSGPRGWWWWTSCCSGPGG